ncbi:MAG: hydroxymethylbilane synthase [Caulobacterales bacterium]|jgi:hydroxymethylbilane synthase
MTLRLRIGARGSPLSLTQTGWVCAELARALGQDPATIEIIPIVTSGDVRQEGRLLEVGGKGLFTKELDEALLAGRIDCAVHSLKDLPTRLPDGIALAAVPAREDVRDAFVSPHADRLEALPAGAVLGTASLRRQAQALHARPDLSVTLLRGNVDTRLRKLAEGQAHATFLAAAGLKRLGLIDRAAGFTDPVAMPPAVGQGALAITARPEDGPVWQALRRIADAQAEITIAAERAFLDALDGSCRTAIGAFATIQGEALDFIGEALTGDGAKRWRRNGSCEAAIDDAAALGRELGLAIKAEAGDALTHAG